ncbi:hypothetical protein D3C85_1948230 [compost metagenome]
MTQAQMLCVQALKAEQFTRGNDHLVRQQTLEHSTHIHLPQGANPYSRAALRLDNL